MTVVQPPLYKLTHCPTCSHLFDVAHDPLCAEVRGLREQVVELRGAVSEAWRQRRPREKCQKCRLCPVSDNFADPLNQLCAHCAREGA